ncbi:unannotated protein [freshwater metagenome]|uniref:Unannotated protein n=1 Tax=freshwater metagenome TaxID=449393 RepID=A0A6J5YEE1_9ZZZZ
MNDSFLSSTALNDTALNGSTKTADMSAPAVPELIRLADAPVEVRDPDIDETLDIDRPWVVLVWNDPINLMSYVTFVLQKVFGYSREKAEAMMLEVHHNGRSVVSNGTREKAELDVFRLHEHGLWATMQQD